MKDTDLVNQYQSRFDALSRCAKLIETDLQEHVAQKFKVDRIMSRAKNQEDFLKKQKKLKTTSQSIVILSIKYRIKLVQELLQYIYQILKKLPIW